MTSARDLVELVRLPAALTVPGDTLAGSVAAGIPIGRRNVALAGASACLYWAGMALNDYADRDLDAVERPERPIPSGRVSPSTALGLAAGLTGAGIGLAALTGPRALAVALPLAGGVWFYDFVAKPTVLGPVVMGVNRSLDVLLGAATAPGKALPAALAIGVHTGAVTALSRGEVHGSSPWVAGSALATTAGIASTITVTAAATGHHPPLARAASVGLAGLYAATVGRAQRDAVRSPDAMTVRRATGVGIRGLVPLQAALLAGAGAVVAAAGLVAAAPALRAASRVFSPT